MEIGQITNSRELEFVVFCIENIASRLSTDAKSVYLALTEKAAFCMITSCRNTECCTCRAKNILCEISSM